MKKKIPLIFSIADTKLYIRPSENTTFDIDAILDALHQSITVNYIAYIRQDNDVHIVTLKDEHDNKYQYAITPDVITQINTSAKTYDFIIINAIDSNKIEPKELPSWVTNATRELTQLLTENDIPFDREKDILFEPHTNSHHDTWNAFCNYNDNVTMRIYDISPTLACEVIKLIEQQSQFLHN